MSIKLKHIAVRSHLIRIIFVSGPVHKNREILNVLRNLKYRKKKRQLCIFLIM